MFFKMGRQLDVCSHWINSILTSTSNINTNRIFQTHGWVQALLRACQPAQIGKSQFLKQSHSAVPKVFVAFLLLVHIRKWWETLNRIRESQTFETYPCCVAKQTRLIVKPWNSIFEQKSIFDFYSYSTSHRINSHQNRMGSRFKVIQDLKLIKSRFFRNN